MGEKDQPLVFVVVGEDSSNSSIPTHESPLTKHSHEIKILAEPLMYAGLVKPAPLAYASYEGINRPGGRKDRRSYGTIATRSLFMSLPNVTYPR